MRQSKIVKVIGREILDSRGNPTVEAEVWLEGGARGLGAVPSGASTGAFEAVEKRDGDMRRYKGKGTQQAAANVSGPIAARLLGMDAADTGAVDAAMLALDATENKGALGANAILAVSIACARAAAEAMELPLYRFLGGAQAVLLPLPMMNVLNGGAHASNNLDVQEFMIAPVGARSFREALRACAEVYASLKTRLAKRGLSTALGDEGGFAPDLDGDEAALELLLEAVDCAGYKAGVGGDFLFSIDAAGSEWKKGDASLYTMPKCGASHTPEALMAHWKALAEKYPLYSIEDPLHEEDWASWQRLTASMGEKLQLVGDDLFVTNPRRLSRGIREGCANAILVKPNQIGSLSESIEAVHMAQKHAYGAIISHRSGETADTLIADLAVALNAGQIKTGAPARGERTAKYNRLLRIEEELGASARYEPAAVLRT